jgi:FixJ family two-component response regulator
METKASQRIRVAVVDDDASLCKALGRLLAAAGISTTIYSSGEAFLADDVNQDPDCLILDIELGGMSGLDLQRVLSTMGREIPIVFITAHEEPELAEQATRLGCVAYLRKTDPGQAVLEAVGRAAGLAKAGGPPS